MRVMIVKNGKVIPGREELWNKLLEKEAVELKKIWAGMAEDPEMLPDVKAVMQKFTDEDWKRDAIQSLVGASYRFGVGEIWTDDGTPQEKET